MPKLMTERPLGFAALLALGLNGVIGVGIFFAPAEVARYAPGLRGLFAYAATALCLLPVALVVARLGALFPRDGGPYVWANASFGPRVAFGVGWVAFVSAVLSTSAVFAGLIEHAAPGLGVTGAVAPRGLGVALILALGVIVAAGLRPSARLWGTITVLKLAPLLALALAGWLGGSLTPRAAPASPPGFAAWRAALVLVFALQGFEIVPVPAGRVRAAATSVPRATWLSLVLAAALYVAIHWACLRGVPQLAGAEAPLVEAARTLSGDGLATLVAWGTNVSALGIAFGMLAMTPRYLAVLGEPGALGAALAQERRAVPQRALLITVVAVVGLVLAGDVASLFALSSVAVLTQYGVSAAALARLAWRGERGLSRRVLWLPGLALGAITLVAGAATAQELALASALVALGFVLRRVVLRRGACS